MVLGLKGKAKKHEIDDILNNPPPMHHRLHIPTKIKKLETIFGTSPALSEHVISLNRLRACIVHRLGVVSNLDIDPKSQKLMVRWLSMKPFADGLESGIKYEIQETIRTNKEKLMIEIHVVEHIREFSIGDNVNLSSFDIFSTIFTLFKFEVSCLTQLSEHMKKLGLDVKLNQHSR